GAADLGRAVVDLGAAGRGRGAAAGAGVAGVDVGAAGAVHVGVAAAAAGDADDEARLHGVLAVAVLGADALAGGLLAARMAELGRAGGVAGAGGAAVALDAAGHGDATDGDVHVALDRRAHDLVEAEVEALQAHHRRGRAAAPGADV